MKLDTKEFRYLMPEDWRVLTAVEMGSKNHEVVPTPLISQLSELRGGSGVHKSISTLAKANLIARTKNAKYDGYRLTYGGLDYLALHTHVKRSTIYSTGDRRAVGKESDIYVCATSAGKQMILKIHRLGRISFRSIKNNRDYLKHRSSASWMYMSRLSALREFSFMKALHENGFNVPEPIVHNRHTVVMALVDALPLRQIQNVPDPAGLYADLIQIVLRLASFGLIHGDFNEFNILVREDEIPDEPEEPRNTLENSMSEIRNLSLNEHGQPPRSRLDPTIPKASISITPVIIDFPQMVSIDHVNAQMYFDRDVECIKRFFERRFDFVSTEPGPYFTEAKSRAGGKKTRRLDVEVEASGFSRKMAKELEKYMQAIEAFKSKDDGQARDSNDETDEDVFSDYEAEQIPQPDTVANGSLHESNMLEICHG